MTDPNAGRPLEGCPVRPLSGDLTCIYPAGHDELHRNFQGITWSDEPGPGRHARRDLVAERLDTEEAIAGPRTVSTRSADERQQALALLSAVETIKATGGAVEIAGVRIEPCDERGRTETTRDLERTQEQVRNVSAAFREQRDKANRLVLDRDEWQGRHAAAVEYAGTLERERDALRAELERVDREPRLGCATTAELIGELAARSSTAETVGERWPAYRTVDGGYEPTEPDAEPAVCRDRHEWPEGHEPSRITHDEAGPVGECTLWAGHIGWHADGMRGGCWPNVDAYPTCDATLDVEYGQKGQAVPCTMRGDHRRHAALIDGVAYRWETTR